MLCVPVACGFYKISNCDEMVDDGKITNEIIYHHLDITPLNVAIDRHIREKD